MTWNDRDTYVLLGFHHRPDVTMLDVMRSPPPSGLGLDVCAVSRWED